MVCDECRKQKYCSHDCRNRKDELERIRRKQYQEFMNAMIEISPEFRGLMKHL